MQSAFAIAMVAAQVSFSGPSGASASRLAVHLIDEGFELVPGGSGAASALAVDTSSSAYLVEARGARTVRYSIEAGPRAVSELELLHRAVLALRAAGTGTTAQARTPLAVIRDPSTLSTDLRGRLILATLDAGYGLTRTATNAVASICVEGEAVGVGERDGPCQATSPLSKPLTPILRALLDQTVRGPAIEGVAQPIVVAHPGDRWRLEVRGAGGATGRASAIDPLVSVGGGAHLGSLGVRADAIVAFASRGEVEALEILALLGPTWRPQLIEGLRFGVGLRVGAHLHRYRVEGSPSGTRVDFTADVPISLAVDLGPLALELEVAAGVSSRARRHERDQEILWGRGLARLLVTLGLSFSVGL